MDANKDDDAMLVAHAMERRAAQRHPILQRCFVRPVAGSGGDSWKGIAYDVSTIGIGVAVPYPLTVGTVLVIEPWELPSAGTVEARIVRVAPLAHLWLCGCELTAPLTDARLRDWMAGSAAAPDRPTKLGW
jgi:PilZ domain